MATTDEQTQAARLLRIHKRNLERLEVQRAEQSGALNLALDNQIDEEKANIAALEPIANPPPKPSPKVAEFVKQTTPGEIDLLMLYVQGVQVNARLTATEDQLRHVIDDQSRAATDRMLTKEAIDGLVTQVGESERARKRGATWYRRAITIALGVAVLALIVGCAALAAVLR